jgi:hypothetical protein
MRDTPEEEAMPLPPVVRALQWLVVALTASMVLGVITVVGVVVTRFPKPSTPPVPETLVLPEGESAQAITQGPDWIGIVSDANRIYIFDRTTGNLRQTVEILTDK